MMTVIISCRIHKWEMGSIHYCHHDELENHWGELLYCLPEKLRIGWGCVSISQAGMRLENLLGTPAN
jgi:hypothetical protein